jgi:hypothetical protein
MGEKIRKLVQQQWAGLIALFLVLSGGTALATHPGGANTISTADIINNEIRSEDIRSANVQNADLGNSAVTSGKIAEGHVRTADVLDDNLTGTDVLNDSLTGEDVDEAALDATPLRTRVAEGGCEGTSPDDVMVKVGPVCVDKYEASIWDAPTGGNQITGTIPCDANGQDCTNIYARSVAGVIPMTRITWFQAQQALVNSGKRLPTNAEWQMAVAGTPDDSEVCNVATDSVENTGSFENCISNHGVNDMVGNPFEWVADWVPLSTACPGWGAFSDDSMCLSGASTTSTGPGALVRGGKFPGETLAGPFGVTGDFPPSVSLVDVGFRGAR